MAVPDVERFETRPPDPKIAARCRRAFFLAVQPVSASLPLPARERALSDVERGRQLRATEDADDEHFNAMHAWTVARTWTVRLAAAMEAAARWHSPCLPPAPL